MRVINSTSVSSPGTQPKQVHLDGRFGRLCRRRPALVHRSEGGLHGGCEPVWSVAEPLRAVQPDPAPSRAFPSRIALGGKPLCGLESRPTGRGCRPGVGTDPWDRCGDQSVTEQEIEAKVIDIVANQLGADKASITRNTSFVEDLNADSLDTVELVMEFEDEFETSIPDDQAENIRTVGQAIDFIKQAQGVE
ncbi:MAG: acyl carrier protein [Phycisphaerales bacterium]|nr:acyl carrier protein [Phycisphaerales bacterium]